MTFGILFDALIKFLFLVFVKIKFLTQGITDFLNGLTFIKNSIETIARIVFDFMIGGLDNFLYIVENLHNEEMGLRFVFGRFRVFEKGFIERGKLDNERSIRINKYFIINLVDSFNDLEVVLNSFIKGQNHDRGLLVAFDGSDESFYFMHRFLGR